MESVSLKRTCIIWLLCEAMLMWALTALCECFVILAVVRVRASEDLHLNKSCTRV
jgi:hypothetical protein